MKQTRHHVVVLSGQPAALSGTQAGGQAGIHRTLSSHSRRRRTAPPGRSPSNVDGLETREGDRPWSTEEVVEKRDESTTAKDKIHYGYCLAAAAAERLLQQGAVWQQQQHEQAAREMLRTGWYVQPREVTVIRLGIEMPLEMSEQVKRAEKLRI